MASLIFILSVLVFTSISSAQEYIDVTSEYKVEFPDDFHYKKDYRIQWWYFTGHLFGENGREFGYELTFFSVNVQKREYKSRFGVNTIYISHFAISDVSEKKFHFSEQADTGAYSFAGASQDTLKVWVGRNMLKGNMKKMRIEASDENNELDLELITEKPVVLNGENGYSRKSEESPLIASIYFSYTNINTKGTLKLGSKIYNVKGKSWFDREISTRGLAENQAGWDWFAIQLDDNREIMLYVLRKKDRTIDIYSSGTFIYEDGRTRHLSRDDFSIKTLAYYNSSKTGARYPSHWEVKIPSEHIVLRINPLIEDQEILAHGTTGNYYWEGTCKVEGTAKGRAYVEMTGY